MITYQQTHFLQPVLMQFYLQLWRNFHEQCLQKDRHAQILEFPEYTQNEIIVTGKQKIEIFVNLKFLFGLIYIYKPPKSIQYKFSSFYL